MGGQTLYRRHECQKPSILNGRDGDVWRCDECKRKWWKDPHAGWVLTFWSSLRGAGNQIEYDKQKANES